jgi:plastocyanin
MRIAIAVGVAAAALALAGCGGGDDEAVTTETETTTQTTTPAGSTLTATVGPGFEISLTGPDGQAVTTLAADEYTIEVDDMSDIHNFHLTGTGVEETTDVGATGTTTWNVTLQEGTYTFVCDPHASSMNGSFEVSG